MLEKFQSLASLDELFAKIADALGVGLDMVQANGMDYVVMYGQYDVIKSLPGHLMEGFLLGFVGALVVGLITQLVVDIDASKPNKITIRLALIAFFVVMVTTALRDIVLFGFAPEIYSIQAVLELLG